MRRQVRSRLIGRETSRGQGLVEFALIFPILMLLLVAIFDLGRLVFAYNDITNAARAGVRTAIVNQGTDVAESTTIQQATSLGLTDSNVTISYLAPDLGGPCPPPYDLGCVAEVVVTFDWQAITPIIGSIVGPVTVTTETRMPIERVYP
ncbi:MAG TPA: TadE/TadG family type IV pilus assembly protein [Candidatus Limnocylindrales bacterium]|nr:TadE/TadG family type IV pilus assembly protein [Candidatus Limnocylindrales bacterium]